MTKQEKLRYEYFFETGIVWIDTNYNIEMDYLEWVENKALNIPVVSKRFFELTRDDLAKFKSDLPIDDISVYDFKSSAISRDEMNKAELITFKDGEQIKELKNKYGLGNNANENLCKHP